jgi:hypothetical protein
MTDTRRDMLMKEYSEISANFRLLTDIRFKLLAFLPIAAGASVLVGGDNPKVVAFSLFGLVVTVGLMTYNMRNDQLYDTLVARAAAIERHLDDPDGAFANRPRAWLEFRPAGFRWPVNHRRGVGTIYLASVALWLFGVINSATPAFHGIATIWQPFASTPFASIVLAVSITLLGAALIKRRHTKSSRELEKLACHAVNGVAQSSSDEATGSGPDPTTMCGDKILVGWLADLSHGPSRSAREAAKSRSTVETRLGFLNELSPGAREQFIGSGTDIWTAALTVAFVTDFAPEWLYDCATRRR